MLYDDSIYEEILQNSILRDSNIRIRSVEGGLTPVVDFYKDRIRNFSMTRTNSYVCNRLPVDECKIELLDWDKFTSTQQTFLMTAGKSLGIRFCLSKGAYEHWTSPLYLTIKKCKANVDGKTATLYLTNSYEFDTYQTEVAVQNTNYFSLPAKMTYAEYLQQSAVRNAWALSTSSNYVYNKGTVDGNYGSNNIYSYDFEVEEDPKDDLRVYGVEDGSGQLLYTVTTDNKSVDLWLERPTRISYGKVVKSSDQSTVSSTLLTFNTRATLTANYSPNESLTYSFYGYELKFPENIKDAHYMQVYFTTNDSDRAIMIEDTFRDYYSNTKYLKIRGRVDPAIEPLDIITTTIEGVQYRIAVEKVEVNFDGGFEGGFEGRVIEQLTNSDIAVSGVTYDDDTGVFSFTVTNNNNFTRRCIVTASAVVGSFEVPANSSVTITNGSYDFCSEIATYFHEWYNEYLQDDVTLKFGRGSTYVLLEANM